MKTAFNNFLKYKTIFLLSVHFLLLSSKIAFGRELNYNNGEKLFFTNCNVCHTNGNNIIIPEKNLKIETLRANGMDNLEAIIYQIINGKNGMPAFGGRLNEYEIEKIASYVLEKSKMNFKNDI
jgi:cytochrome c6